MVEKQIEVVVLSGDFEVKLASHKCKPLPQLQKEIADVFNQAVLEVPFEQVRSQREKVKVVWVFDEFLSKVRLRLRQGAVKIGQRRALTLKEPALDLMHQDIAAPAVFERLSDVPFSLARILHRIENPDLVAPGQLCNNLLHKFLVRVGFGKCPHVLQIPGPKSSQAGE